MSTDVPQEKLQSTRQSDSVARADAGPERPFRVGARVAIKSAAEILATLDMNGRHEGLPWMPQMVDLCGESATIVKWVTSSCMPSENGVLYGGVSDAVLLNVGRCDGQSFGGCQMDCPLIWKTAWLSNEETFKVDDCSDAASELRELAETNAITADGCAKCQATQLVHIANPETGSRLKQYANEMNLNRVSMSTIATSFCGGMLARLSGASGAVQGVLKRTPVTDLQLKVGEKVRVKSRDEIVDTLNADGKNRGLWFDPVMLRYCGQELTVSKRVTVLVDETNGKIRNLKVPSVVLDDLRCDSSQRRFCVRLLQLFWREAWLERVSS